jgi:DNA sulfur modification protein DndB
MTPGLYSSVDETWGSGHLAAIAARTVQALTEIIGGTLFRRVVAQGMKRDDIICLTMTDIKGGIHRSHLVGSLAQRRKLLISGPLSADSDERTVVRATEAINQFFEHLRSANPARWDSGRPGGFCVNIGVRAMLLLFHAVIKHAEAKRNNFDVSNASPEEIVAEAVAIAKPLIEFLRSVPDAEFLERFDVKPGSGGPPEFFYELSHVIWKHDGSFAPQGLAEYIASKDDKRVKEAEYTIKFIENRTTEIIIDYFKKIHGNNYWNYVGTKEMRVKAYENQQGYPPEKQQELEVYLDFIDKKKIIEKNENWGAFKIYFDIPLRGEKGYAKNLKWMDRLNELRRVVAHSYKRTFKPDDLEFLEWIRKAFEEKLLAVGTESSPLLA